VLMCTHVTPNCDLVSIGDMRTPYLDACRFIFTPSALIMQGRRDAGMLTSVMVSPANGHASKVSYIVMTARLVFVAKRGIWSVWPTQPERDGCQAQHPLHHVAVM